MRNGRVKRKANIIIVHIPQLGHYTSPFPAILRADRCRWHERAPNRLQLSSLFQSLQRRSRWATKCAKQHLLLHCSLLQKLWLYGKCNYVASVFADGTISVEMSRITRVSFLDLIFRTVMSNRSSRNKEWIVLSRVDSCRWPCSDVNCYLQASDTYRVAERVELAVCQSVIGPWFSVTSSS